VFQLFIPFRAEFYVRLKAFLFNISRRHRLLFLALFIKGDAVNVPKCA
jgi:hypothetical protein